MIKPDRLPPLFYVDTQFDTGNTIEIRGEEAGHILQSRRYRPGDQIFLTNGLGVSAQAVIDETGRNVTLKVTITQCDILPVPSPRMVLASAIPKGDRQGAMLGMGTQLGMNAYIPLECEHSVVKYKQAMVERWRRIIIAACKQSRQCYFPEILAPCNVRELLGEQATGRVLVVADALGDTIGSISGNGPAIAELVLMVGPEGGFSTSEISLLEHANVLKLQLSNQILRTETAAVSLLAAINQSVFD